MTARVPDQVSNQGGHAQGQNPRHREARRSGRHAGLELRDQVDAAEGVRVLVLG